MFITRTSLVLILGQIFTPSAHAQQMSAVEIFQRCQIRLTRGLPTESGPLVDQLKAGTKKPEDACIELFDSGRFGTNGLMLNPTSADGKMVVKTLNDLHRSWFQGRSSTESGGGTLVFRDLEEQALYITRAAFQQNVKFDSIVTLKSGLQGVRDPEIPAPGKTDFEIQTITRHSPDTTIGTSTVAIVQYRKATISDTGRVTALEYVYKPVSSSVEVGSLVGVKAATSLVLESFVGNFRGRLPIGTTAANRDLAAALIEASPNFQANEHLGSGIIGSQGFITNNTNIYYNEFPEGELIINRRLASRIFEDLLCHQMPSLKTEDVPNSMIDANSEYSFRKSKSCMQCHASNDQLAFTFRNQYLFLSGQIQVSEGQGFPIVGMAQLPTKPGSTSFPLQRPTGNLFYRQLLEGAVVNRSLASVDEIGANLANEPDLYLCAAKRYYQFLTGINVNLTRLATEELDLKHQKIVVDLGRDFHSHRNVRQLLLDIFSSKTFKTRNYLSSRKK